MKKPLITIHDAVSDETVTREMTEEEYAALIESGWTESTEETEPE